MDVDVDVCVCVCVCVCLCVCVWRKPALTRRGHVYAHSHVRTAGVAPHQGPGLGGPVARRRTAPRPLARARHQLVHV